MTECLACLRKSVSKLGKLDQFVNPKYSVSYYIWNLIENLSRLVVIA